MAEAIIQVRDLSFSYESKKSAPETLKSLNFEIQAGRMTGLLGPNGSGKSTLFKILSTQIQDFKGQVVVGGFDILQEPSQVRSLMGVTFQSPSLDPHLTVQENLQIYGQLVGLSGTQLKTLIPQSLKQFRVLDRAQSRVKTLSGGLARRVEIAKSLLGNPKILLLDEPTSGLDVQSRVELWAELKNWVVTHKTTVLVTTHLMEEAELCDDLVFISEGQCRGVDSTENFKKNFAHDIIELGFTNDQDVQKFIAEQSHPETVIKMGRKLRLLTPNSKQKLAQYESMYQNSLDYAAWGRASLADIYFEKTGRPLV
jgi:ABC-2 type transport system ATP-binding protein